MTQLFASKAQLHDGEFYARNPYPDYRELRSHAPVYRYEWDGVGFWAISKWKDVRATLFDPGRFSSASGTTINDVQVVLRGERPLWNQFMPPEADNLINSDPPLHSRTRRLVNRAFSPSVVNQLEPWIRSIARDTIDRIEPGRAMNVVPELAVPFPISVIASLLGIPPEDWTDIKRWSDLGEVLGGETLPVERLDEIMTSALELFEYLQARLDERRDSVGADLISRLLSAEIEGGRLNDASIMMMSTTLLFAGNETTRNLISGALLALIQHPLQRERLVADPDLLQSAVDEFVRWVTPLHTVCRRATEDAMVGGQHIKAGEHLVLLLGSANRDEEVWDSPDTFDVGRTVDPTHVAFGYGEHFCIGASLARLETRVFFEELLSRYRRFDLVSPAVKPANSLFNAVDELHVAFHEQ